MTTSPIISVESLYKSFRLPHQKSSTLKSSVISLARSPNHYTDLEVLRDVTFDIQPGEFFGIIGRNGSGKSTLLKLLAGVYYPNQGTVDVRGAVTPFIELGVGFNMELSGRDNVYLNGALLGFDHNDVDSMYSDIVRFAELEEFMDQKLKNYSSGMQVRLAFSIAVRAETEILLIDEVLAVGDARFQQKCFNYFYELKEGPRTIVFISHDTDAVLRYCDRCLYLDDGVCRALGPTKDVVDTYLLDVFHRSSGTADEDRGEIREDFVTSARVLSCEISPEELDSHDVVNLTFEYEILLPTDPEIRFAVVKDGQPMAHASTKRMVLEGGPGKYRAEFQMMGRTFMNGEHTIAAGIFHAQSGEQFDLHPNIGRFYIRDDDETLWGPARIEGSWTSLELGSRAR